MACRRPDVLNNYSFLEVPDQDKPRGSHMWEILAVCEHQIVRIPGEWLNAIDRTHRLLSQRITVKEKGTTSLTIGPRRRLSGPGSLHLKGCARAKSLGPK